MDISTIIGFTLGSAAILYSLMGGEGGLRPFWDFDSVLITIGGTIAALFIAFPLAQLKEVPKMVAIAFRERQTDPLAIISDMVELAEKARREGLLALEDSVANTDDQFLKRGIQLIVDGTDPELVRDILETDLNYIEDRHKSGRAVFDAMTNYAPAYGMIGTLVGLVQMLRTLDKPSTIGPAMSVALITTFYGAVIANFISGPISNKLATKSSSEIQLREMMLEGILSIQSGENPRIVEEKLVGFLSPKDRKNAMELARGRKTASQGQSMAEAEGGAVAR